MVEPQPMTSTSDRHDHEDVVAVLNVEKAICAMLEAEVRTMGLGNLDAADALRVTKARIAMLQRLSERTNDPV